MEKRTSTSGAGDDADLEFCQHQVLIGSSWVGQRELSRSRCSCACQIPGRYTSGGGCQGQGVHLTAMGLPYIFWVWDQILFDGSQMFRIIGVACHYRLL